MNKAKSYVRETLARIKGDGVKVIAEKNYRKASAGINGQLAALNGKLVEEEEKVETAKEELENAKYPTELIGNVSSYVEKIRDRQAAYDRAVESLANVKESIEYYTELLKGFDVEESVEEDKVNEQA